MTTLRELLGSECSAVGSYPLASSVAAYAIYRGVVLAATGTDRTSAEAALQAKVQQFLPQLLALEELVTVEEVNLVLDQTDTTPRRVFVRQMTPQRALLELDLGVDGAIIFRDPTDCTFAVQSRAADGTSQHVHLGEPVHGDDVVARPLPIPGVTPGPAAADSLRMHKKARIRELLRCPLCRGVLQDRTGGLACVACARDFPDCDGRPFLPTDSSYDGSPRGKLESQNPYGQQVIQLIEQYRDGLVLDMGSGSPRRGFFNVVHLDLSAYAEVDIVTDGQALPFADETFDAILSEAVLEHVRDPHAYMLELARVLKPGGRARLDVAFLQPFHAYPNHFFNMTRPGLEVTVERAGLKVQSIGVGEHQQPWIALGLLLAGIVHGTSNKAHQQKILGMTVGEMLQRFEKRQADEFKSLPREVVERLAAGFWCIAEKPERE
jgi:SAM-dependent methyltransferase